MPFTTAVPEPVPQPPAPDVQRFTVDGRPTMPQIDYERKLLAWQRSIIGWLQGMAGAVALDADLPVVGSGAFTPSLAGSTTAGAHTYTTRLGYYQRVNNLITFVVAITLSAKDAAMAGNVRITGLPGTPNATLDTAVLVGGGNLTLSNASAQLIGLVPAGQNYVALREVRSTTALTALTAAGVGSTSTFIAAGSYQTS